MFTFNSITRSILIRLACILFLPLMMAVLPGNSNADWLEDMSRDAQRNLDRQRSGGGGAQAIEHWYAMCNKPGRYVVLGKQVPANHSTMSGPYGNEPSARNWVNSNCPSWKCDENGRCVQPPKGGGSGGSGGAYDSDPGCGGLFGQGGC